MISTREIKLSFPNLHMLPVCLVLHQKIYDFYRLFFSQKNVDTREDIPTAAISISQSNSRKFIHPDIIPLSEDPVESRILLL